jgi:preprotein translocase subunit SecG
MLKKMARATFLLMLTFMVVAWALSLGKSETQHPQNDQPAEPWNIYS